jgi:CRISPR-associated protein Cmr3
MIIFIEPDDVWLFRDGRPFAAGEDHIARSFFPPTPQTMQGAIRSARLAQSGEPFNYRQWPDHLKDEIGQPNNFGALRLAGPLLARREEDGAVVPFFPHPQDVVKLKDGWRTLAPQQGRHFQSDWLKGLQPLWPSQEGEPEKFEPGWLSKAELANYLSDKDFSVTKTRCLFDRERRFSVEIEGPGKRSREGHLFAVEFIRLPRDVGLLVEVDGVMLASAGLLQLGGEARAARYREVEASLQLTQEGRTGAPANGKTRFKLYLAAPAIFHQGWLPGWIGRHDLSGAWNGLHVRLVSAAVGKAQPVGGRDIAHGSQRSIRRAVPAGSVYFFEAEASADAVMKAFDGKCVSDVDAQIGFGLCYAGGW